ncbi:hypothetical protein D3C78_1805750 [compost metagenome]
MLLRQLMARLPRLRHLNNRLANLEDISDACLGFQQSANRYILSECAEFKLLAHRLRPIGVVLLTVNAKCLIHASVEL